MKTYLSILLILNFISLSLQIDNNSSVVLTKGIVEIQTSDYNFPLALCGTNFEKKFAQLICMNTLGTSVKSFSINESCQNASALDYSQPMQFVQILEEPNFGYHCRSDDNKRTLSNFGKCIKNNSFNFDGVCSPNNCVSVECYTQEEKQKQLDELPENDSDDVTVFQKDDNLIAYTSQYGYRYVQHKDYDLEQPLDVHQGDAFCKKLGYDKLVSATLQKCKYFDHIYIDQYYLLFQHCSSDDELIDCISQTSKAIYLADDCTYLKCEHSAVSETGLILIIVFSSLAFVIIVIVAACCCCKKDKTQEKKAKQVDTKYDPNYGEQQDYSNNVNSNPMVINGNGQFHQQQNMDYNQQNQNFGNPMMQPPSNMNFNNQVPQNPMNNFQPKNQEYF